jgi:hypothetical protein
MPFKSFNRFALFKPFKLSAKWVNTPSLKLDFFYVEDVLQRFHP